MSPKVLTYGPITKLLCKLGQVFEFWFHHL